MMEASTSICTACWQGTYVNGICGACQHKQTAPEDRRADALPLMDIIHGRYAIGEVLGKGGYGITYSAWDNVKLRRVALKELFPNKSVTRGTDGRSVVPNEGHEIYFSELKEKFEEEAKHPQQLAEKCNAVKVYDLFHGNNTVYYTMEYLEGCDLNVYRKNHGPLPWDFLAPIMKEVLRTLIILHKENLIHRDIAPDNIFLTKDGQVKLIDFGAARAYQGTQVFTVQKKVSFAPWEQLESSGNQGPWTDLYSLSVTMYLLLSGKLPPKAQDRIYGKPVIPLRKWCPDLPENVARTIEKGMSIKIRDRFLTAREYMQALFPEPVPTTDDKKGRTVPEKTLWVRGKKGYYAGQKKQLSRRVEVRFGRWHTNDVTYPDSIAGVSRHQFALYVDGNGNPYVKDIGSSFGTFLNEERLGPEWKRAKTGDYIRFGNEEFQLIYQ